MARGVLFRLWPSLSCARETTEFREEYLLTTLDDESQEEVREGPRSKVILAPPPCVVGAIRVFEGRKGS